MKTKAILNNLNLYSEKNVNKFLLSFYSQKLEKMYKNRYEKNTKPSLCDGVKSMSASQLLDYFTDGNTRYSVEYDDEKEDLGVVDVYENVDDVQANMQELERYDLSEKVGKKSTENSEIQAEDKKENVATEQVKKNNNDIVASETKQQ